MSPSVVLYSRPGCGLCRRAREELEAVRRWHPFDLEEIDVTADPDLERSYGLRIPVVVMDDREVFEIEVDRRELRRLLRAARR